MGVKIFDKLSLKKKLKEAKRMIKELEEEASNKEINIESDYMKIGKIIIESDIHIDDDIISTIKKEVSKLRVEINYILGKKNTIDGEVEELEEKLRKLDGKGVCPSCGHVYEKDKDILFCSKCGCDLMSSDREKND